MKQYNVIIFGTKYHLILFPWIEIEAILKDKINLHFDCRSTLLATFFYCKSNFVFRNDNKLLIDVTHTVYSSLLFSNVNFRQHHLLSYLNFELFSIQANYTWLIDVACTRVHGSHMFAIGFRISQVIRYIRSCHKTNIFIALIIN